MKSNKVKRFFTLQRKYLSIPYIVFLVLFILVPIGIVMFYAFTYEYTDPVTGAKYIKASGEAFLNFFTSWSKWNVLFVSLFIATSPIPASWNSTNDGEHNSLTPIITKSSFPSSVPFSATNSKKTKKMKKSDILFAYVIFLL